MWCSFTLLTEYFHLVKSGELEISQEKGTSLERGTSREKQSSHKRGTSREVHFTFQIFLLYYNITSN
jgi:hypothetical protein